MPKTPDFLSSFNYFETLFHKTKQNTVLLMNKEGSITEINGAFSESFGYTREEIIGQNFSILFTKEDQLKGQPQKELNTVLYNGQAMDNNYLVNKNGHVTWVSGESVLVKGKKDEVSILKIIQNIHQQKLSEISLLRMNDFNESILKSVEDAIIVLNADMNIIKANQAFSKLFNHVQLNDTALNFAKLIKPFDINNDLLSSIENTIITKKVFLNNQIEIQIPTGEKRIFDVSCTSMQYTDDPDNVLIIMHDITIHKLVEREREDIIGFVAHELRNPLANVVLCNELMGDAIKDNNPEEVNDMLQRSKNNVMRLNKMIAELYDAAKMNSGNLKLDVSSFNVNNMIQEAIDTVEGIQPSYNIIVKGSADIQVEADKYRIIQVVTNYLSNGIKYSNGHTDVVLTIQHDDKSVTVSVKDNGLGISRNQLPYIFERFFRAEKTKNLEGIGLGLYLCRQIIHAHHGHVWAESEEGKGSVFYFSIPLKYTPDPWQNYGMAVEK